MNKNNIEIVSLVYKSIDYLHLITTQLQSSNCVVDGYDVGVRLVLNDATDEVIEEVKNLGISYTIYNDKDPDEFYINRVYRCFNFAATTSEYDNVCFVNSDMVFSENWITNLLKHHDGVNIPCCKLVESGKMLSGKYAVSQDFGKSPLNIKTNEFSVFAEHISEDKVYNGGLYMPCVFNTEHFISSGMYPEGNLYVDGIGTVNGKVIQSGDQYYFANLIKNYNMKHITVFDSVVYHIQEGEKDS